MYLLCAPSTNVIRDIFSSCPPPAFLLIRGAALSTAESGNAIRRSASAQAMRPGAPNSKASFVLANMVAARGDEAAASKTSRPRKKSTGNSKSPADTTRAAAAMGTENDAETASLVAALLRAGRVAERSNAGKRPGAASNALPLAAVELGHDGTNEILSFASLAISTATVASLALNVVNRLRSTRSLGCAIITHTPPTPPLTHTLRLPPHPLAFSLPRLLSTPARRCSHSLLQQINQLRARLRSGRLFRSSKQTRSYCTKWTSRRSRWESCAAPENHP